MTLVVFFLQLSILAFLGLLYGRINTMAATQEELRAAITNLQEVATQIIAALQVVKIIDLTAEVNTINAIVTSLSDAIIKTPE